MAKLRKAEKRSADAMVRNLALSLIRDFQDSLNDPNFCSDLQLALRAGDVVRIRELSPTPTQEMDKATFKAMYQLQSVFKRYRFETDIYSDEELIQKAVESFGATQSRIASLDLGSLPQNSQRVLDLASVYIARVLGVYDGEEHRNLSRFGRKASVGVPARMACEAARWELPISGSREQINWFDSEMSQYADVQEYWNSQKSSDPPGMERSTYQEIGSLKLTLVPKTFKSLRAIMPNSTIGSYMSYGLGEIIRKRLRRNGFDIRSLQVRHRLLACQASVHGLYVTADLSSASDSISVALVNRLFPADWVEILTKSRIGVVDLPDGTSVESQTFCTMGIGYTFPLQTLVFLALLKAVEATLYHRWNRRTVSVYGDDMIYAAPMHSEVVRLFEEFGFVINVDKTFHEGNFKESCGGDYYHGVDVRPFQPRNGSAYMGDKPYEATLYKYVNGLLARWSEYEIGRTLLYLVTEIESVTGKCKLVPQDHPDDSGIKCPSLSYWSFLQYAQVAKPKQLGNGVYRFSYLRLVSDEREELRHVPYYWAALRGSAPYRDYHGNGNDLKGSPSFYAEVIDYVTGAMEDVRLLKSRDVVPVETFRSSYSGCRLRRKTTFVTVSHTGRYTRQSGISCFETRR